jgi:(2R)-ethylmalonyl-CoA mutase
VADVVARLKEAGLDDVPVVVGGIIPPEDESALKKAGVAAVYTPKDFELNRIMADVLRIVENAADCRKMRLRDEIASRMAGHRRSLLA